MARVRRTPRPAAPSGVSRFDDGSYQEAEHGAVGRQEPHVEARVGDARSSAARSSRSASSTPTTAGPNSRSFFLMYSNSTMSSLGPGTRRGIGAGPRALGEVHDEVVLEALVHEAALDDLVVAGHVVVPPAQDAHHGRARRSSRPRRRGRRWRAPRPARPRCRRPGRGRAARCTPGPRPPPRSPHQVAHDGEGELARGAHDGAVDEVVVDVDGDGVAGLERPDHGRGPGRLDAHDLGGARRGRRGRRRCRRRARRRRRGRRTTSGAAPSCSTISRATVPCPATVMGWSKVGTTVAPVSAA